MTPLLATRRLTRRFGGVSAVDDLDLVVPGGGITGLIGPNGAGKTTVFNILSGVIPPTSGRFEIGGIDATGRRPDQIARLGVARTFQNLNLFRSMSVLENVMVPRHLHSRAGVATALLRLPRGRREEDEAQRRAEEVLERLHIAHLAGEVASSLSFGHQRRVEIARALAAEPRLLLLDEPMAGLSRGEVAELHRLVRGISAEGVTILLVEHDMATVMGLCERVVVLDHGRLIADATPAEVQADEDVISAYLGADLDELAG